ncbi:hypothetical protein B0H13DRAFT_1889573 [Mycena leptocephala]|nr:hypothetical protein B0H13DRAFT_1889573 [Mycena leptocephala]
MASTGAEAEPVVKCDRCDYTGIQLTSPKKKSLAYNKSCFNCKEKQGEYRAAKRSTRKDADSGDATGGTRRAPPVQPIQGYATLEWPECAALLEAHKNDPFELETFVAMTGDSAAATFGELKRGKDIANQIAQLLWNITAGWRRGSTAQAERPELARESASVNGGNNQSSTGGEQTVPSENDSHKDTEAARMDGAPAEDKDVAEEDSEEGPEGRSDRDGRVTVSEARTLNLKMLLGRYDGRDRESTGSPPQNGRSFGKYFWGKG